MDDTQYLLGIAHDLRNVVLFPLGAYVDLAQRALRDGDTGRALALLARMTVVLQQGDATIERLRRDRSVRPAVTTDADLDAIAVRAAELARARLRGDRTTLAVEPAAGGRIRGDEEELIAAVVNVIANAIDAVADQGGTITVRTGGDAERAWIEIADDGPGISAEVRARLFDPFVTTKGATAFGIGLAMVEACVRRHGGALEVDSAPGCGARFRLRFPRP